MLVEPVVPVEPIDPVELDDDERLPRDERPERDEVPVVLPPELVDDIEPLPVEPIEPVPIDPPLLIEPDPVEPMDPVDPIEPAPIDPPLLDMPAPEAPAEPEPPAAPDAPAPPPAAPPPPACAITAAGAKAMAAAMITNLRMFLSCYVSTINQSVPDWFLCQRRRGAPSAALLARLRGFRYRLAIQRARPAVAGAERVRQASFSRALFAWKAAAATLVQRVPRRATGPRGSSAKDLRINRMAGNDC